MLHSFYLIMLSVVNGILVEYYFIIHKAREFWVQNDFHFHSFEDSNCIFKYFYIEAREMKTWILLWKSLCSRPFIY